jgi:hypothetical protein
MKLIRSAVRRRPCFNQQASNERRVGSVEFNERDEMLAMPLFYFDVRDGEKFTVDEQGRDCKGIEGARDQAMARLAERAKDVLPGPVRRRLAIEVRDDNAKEPMLVIALMFEVARPMRVRRDVRDLRALRALYE